MIVFMKIAIHLSSKYPLTHSNTLVVWVDFDTLYLLSCLLYHFIYMDRDREGEYTTWYVQMGKENGNTHTMSSKGPSSSTCTYNKLGEVLDAPWLKVRYFVIALCDNKSYTLLDVGGILLSELKNQITMCEWDGSYNEECKKSKCAIPFAWWLSFST